MGLTRKLYGMTLVVIGISTFPLSAPTLAAASVSLGTITGGLAIIIS